MAEYRNTDGSTTYVERRSNSGKIIAGIVVLALVIVGVLFATGFWSADVEGGKLPQVEVNAKGGDLPSVDMDSKEVVVGTKKTEVDVPVVGVKDNGEK